MHILDTIIRRLEEHLEAVYYQINALKSLSNPDHDVFIRGLEVETYSVEEALIILERAREENKL